MNVAHLGLYSVDPAGLDAFHCFDPESFVALLAINDALIAIGTEGEVVPSLATSWDRTGPLELEMELRRGVRFHNGEPFDADSVVATFRHHQHPTPSACGGGILAPIVDVERLGTHRIRIKTAFPDAMLVRRLFFFAVYPAGVLEAHGREAMRDHPIGTGAWRFVHWHRGTEILLARNPDHWTPRGTLDQVRIPIVRQKEWVDHLAAGELDVILNIDSHDVIRAARKAGVQTESREAALSQWFLLANRGPLADVRVRRALNHAIKRSLIAEVSEHGLAKPQRTVATAESWGHADDVEPFLYAPELARRMLAEAGYPDGFTLQGLVSETSTGVYFAVREFLARVGVELSAEIVPRSQWLGRIQGGNMRGQPYDGDFAVSNVDNPLVDSVFHQFVLLFSEGPLSITRSEAFDQRFLATATAVGDEGESARQSLERYAVEQAMLLFTVQQQVHAAWRTGCTVPLPRSGHFNSMFWWNLDVPARTVPSYVAPAPPDHSDVRLLLEATSHTGTFYLPPEEELTDGWARRLWQSLQTSEQRWHVAHEPMLRELVTQIEARNNLASILTSTQRVAIVGYSPSGRQRFANAGFTRLFGDDVAHVSQVIEHPSWAELTQAVDEEGVWLGPVTLDSSNLPEETPGSLYLTATRALDDEGAPSGLTLVLSDFSGEEERIKNQAIRTILDNVPYGLFLVGPDGRVRAGVSEACRGLFPNVDVFEGACLAELMDADARLAATLELTVGQVFDSMLPEHVALAQIPARLDVGGRCMSLTARAVRDGLGAMEGLLFTVADISELVEAEREVEQIRGTLKVLRYRDRFEAFVHSFAEQIRHLEADPDSAHWQSRARRLLHTAKGVFGQFGIGHLTRRIHGIEDAAVLSVQHLREARVALQVLLDENAELWGVALERTETAYSVTSATLGEFDARLQGVQTADEARALLRSLIAEVQCKPAGEVLGPIRDAVTQLAGRLGKQVRATVDGGEHRLPERLGPVFDQLGHLIRNAVDHGIEPPHERGDKDPTATIAVAIRRDAGGWSITVSDDGRGIDPDTVAQRAVDLGMVPAAQVQQMSIQDRLELLFIEGLSTSDGVTDTSGRGVGMSAVWASVEDLGGHIHVSSARNRGTRFELVLPDSDAELELA